MARPKILIVDDQVLIQEIASDILEEAGFEPIVANDAEEARAILWNVVPDLILLDWSLPDANGLQLLEEMETTVAVPNVPCIMLTGRRSVAFERMARSQGAVDYLRKPFTPEELVIAVTRALRDHAARGTPNPEQVAG